MKIFIKFFILTLGVFSFVNWQNFVEPEFKIFELENYLVLYSQIDSVQNLSWLKDISVTTVDNWVWDWSFSKVFYRPPFVFYFINSRFNNISINTGLYILDFLGTNDEKLYTQKVFVDFSKFGKNKSGSSNVVDCYFSEIDFQSFYNNNLSWLSYQMDCIDDKFRNFKKNYNLNSDQKHSVNIFLWTGKIFKNFDFLAPPCHSVNSNKFTYYSNLGLVSYFQENCWVIWLDSKIINFVRVSDNKELFQIQITNQQIIDSPDLNQLKTSIKIQSSGESLSVYPNFSWNMYLWLNFEHKYWKEVNNGEFIKLQKPQNITFTEFEFESLGLDYQIWLPFLRHNIQNNRLLIKDSFSEFEIDIAYFF